MTNNAADNLPKKQKLLTFASGGWIILLAVLFTAVTALYILWPAIRTGFAPAIGDGVHLSSYHFDLSNCRIPQEKIHPVARKDEIRAIVPETVETMNETDLAAYFKENRRNFLVSTDRVVGITVNGQSRAYPLLVLVQHEIVNDEIAGLPVAVTYSPLCDSVVVFDRRAGSDGKIREFHHSGLLINSAPLYYDRQTNPAEESLWGQLQLECVAGPCAGVGGAPLKRLDYALTTWSAWKSAHPDTRVLAGLPQFRKARKYDDVPYQVYLESNSLQFPVDPLWPDSKIPVMTRIIATPTDAGKWTITRSDAANSADPSSSIHALLFAWYAAHPDSDFTALKPAK